MRPWQMILLGFVLILLGGITLPLLMVIQVIPSTFFLNFSSYSAGVIGLFLGIIGMSRYARNNRKK